jgi:hypothetical protein
MVTPALTVTSTARRDSRGDLSRILVKKPEIPPRFFISWDLDQNGNTRMEIGE